MKLFKTIRYIFSGSKTEFLQAKMRKFIPKGEESVYFILNDLQGDRQYLPFHTSTFTSFVSKIQKHYISQKQFGQRFLKIYKMMEKMEMINDCVKQTFHKTVCNFLQRESTRQSIKSQKLQNLMWWLFRQFPFKHNRFFGLAGSYTVRLHDIFDYMNSLNKLPAWQPYIRVSYMLKFLGHNLECRTDMFKTQVIQAIDRHYLIYLLELFQPAKYQQFAKQMSMPQPLLLFLCEHYIKNDDIEFDKYLQRVQYIDNIAPKEEINCTMDSIHWKDLVEGWKLAALASSQNALTETDQHKFADMFWRKLETSDIQAEEITTLTKMLFDFPTLFFDKRQSIILRMLESFYEKKDEQLEFFSANGFKEMIRMAQFLPIDDQSIKKFTRFLYQKLYIALNWQQGDAELILQIIEKKYFEGKQKMVAYLKTKINNQS